MADPSPIIPSSDLSVSPGQLLGGKYRLVRLLGEGGMGNVWLARNELLGSDVALKIVRPDARGNETTERLLMEARVQANLRHPNVARVFDYGQAPNGDSYLVLELLEGYSLAELLERHGALPPEQAVKILLPIIDALCASHSGGVVHRDLKPDNIFIARSGAQLCPKLLDFGIAKLEGRFDRRLTGSGGVVGSPAYMAPEQARGQGDVDQRVDVWAACVVLYEMVTGKPVFDADNYHALLRAVIESEPAPLTDPACQSLWPILRAGLAKDRAERTATMCELGEALSRWLVEQGDADERDATEWHWSPGVRDSIGLRALTGRPSRLGSWGRGLLSASAPSYEHRSGTRTARTGEMEQRSRAWRMSLAAAVGGALLAFGVGQAWLPVQAEHEPESEDEVAVARPAAPPPAVAAAPQPRAVRSASSSAPAPKRAREAESAIPRGRAERAPVKAIVNAAPPAPESPVAVAVMAEPPPEPAAPRPRLTAADLMVVGSSANPARPSEPVRLISAAPRPVAVAPAVRAREPAPLPAAVATPSAAKRRPAQASSEADLGLKSPW